MYYLGIDFGTTGVRAGLYNREGDEIGFSSAAYPTKSPRPGFAEQSPMEWWTSLGVTVKDLLKTTGISPSEVVALAVDFHSCSVMLCSRDGDPLMDCLIWMDVRAAAESDEINRETGESLSPEWMPAKLLWLKRNKTALYDSAEVFCEAEDWMNYKLTGKWSVNINCSVNWGYNSDLGCFSLPFYQKIGMPEAVDRFPSDHVYAVGDVIGCLTEEAARHLGLSENTIVACGGIDSSIGILGMGAAEEGKLALCTGSSNLAMVLTKKPLFNQGGVNIGPNHLIHGYYTDYRGQTASGSIIQWAKKNLYADLPDDGAYRIMDAEAEKVPPGSEGLLVLDYFQGNKHPYLDGSVRGMIYGLSLSHTRAHIYRALLEGICMETAHLLRQFGDAGREIHEISLSGGFAKSPLLLSLLADICGVTVNVPENSQCSCLGSGIVAATAAGAWPDLQTASRGMTRFRSSVSPVRENHEKYQRLFDLYLNTYPELKAYFKKVSDTFEEI